MGTGFPEPVPPTEGQTMATQLLTDVDVKAAKKHKKLQRLRDGAGLYLVITPMGAKSWQYGYTIDTPQARSSRGSGSSSTQLLRV
jgi:hypothetical protein